MLLVELSLLMPPFERNGLELRDRERDLDLDFLDGLRTVEADDDVADDTSLLAESLMNLLFTLSQETVAPLEFGIWGNPDG